MGRTRTGGARSDRTVDTVGRTPRQRCPQPRTSRIAMAPAEPIRLVLSDVDGTLVDSDKSLTEATIAAVKPASMTPGSRFAVTSGRPPRGMSMLVEPLGLTTPMAAFNGGEIVTPELEEIGHDGRPRGTGAGDPRTDLPSRPRRAGSTRVPTGTCSTPTVPTWRGSRPRCSSARRWWSPSRGSLRWRRWSG